MQRLRFKLAKNSFTRGLRGPHMLAFLPALCLASYWLGGEILLVTSALFTPVLYAASGGFDRSGRGDDPSPIAKPTLHDVAQDFLDIAKPNGQVTACFQIGISGFDDITRTFGDEAGRDAQALVQGRLDSALRQTDRVFRVADGRYVVLIAPGFRLKLDTLLDLATRLREAVETPLSVEGGTAHLTLAVGIASSLNFGRNVTSETWLAAAAQALSEAVLAGPSKTRVWSDKLSRRVSAQHSLRDDLRGGFEKGEIQTAFQPQIAIRTGRLVGMEAQARWDHPTAGTIRASQLARAAMDSGQSGQLAQLVLVQALTALQGWDQTGLDVPEVTVPLGDPDLRNPDLPGQISEALHRTGLAAGRLVLALPEPVIASGLDDLQRRNLTSLADIGCALDLDGFGAGSASVLVLQAVRFRRIRIDPRLIRGIDNSEQARRMLGAVLTMIDRLDLEALAKDVETIEEMSVLRDLGCAFVQGHLIAEAMSLAEVPDWIGAHPECQTPGASSKIRRVK